MMDVRNWSPRALNIAGALTVLIGVGAVAGIAGAAGGSPGASCSADSYDGSTLALHCTVARATKTIAKGTATVTATSTVTVTASPTSSDPTTPTPTDPTTPTPTPTPPASGSYVDPATTGYQGATSDLKVVPDQGVPAGCQWNTTYAFLDCRSSAVLDHVLVKGYVDAYSDLTIRDSVVQASNKTIFLVELRGSGKTATISNSTLHYDNQGGYPQGQSTWGVAGVNDAGGTKIVATSNDISGTPDGIDPGTPNSMFRDNYIHDLAAIGATHNDGMQLYGCAGCVIDGNYFDVGWDGEHQNSCFFTSDGGGSPSGIQFTNNYLSGGGFAFRDYNAPDMIVTGNTFHPLPNQFGQTDRRNNGSFAVWSGNVTTTGAVVPQP